MLRSSHPVMNVFIIPGISSKPHICLFSAAIFLTILVTLAAKVLLLCFVWYLGLV
jgi:hypothetical protein